jgi:hypothetical protein
MTLVGIGNFERYYIICLIHRHPPSFSFIINPSLSLLSLLSLPSPKAIFACFLGGFNGLLVLLVVWSPLFEFLLLSKQGDLGNCEKDQ